MKAVILAAGQGVRLGELTKDIPKPMITLAGKPALDYIICGIHSAGIEELVLVVRYKAEKIIEHFGDGSRFGIKIDYVQQSDACGTGAALLAARESVAGSNLLMTYGDIITSSVNYAGAVRGFEELGGAGVMTLNWVDDPSNGASVTLDSRGCVSQIIEKPPKGEFTSNWHSAGLFVFEPTVFDYLVRIEPSPRGEYEIGDAINKMIADNHDIHAYFLQGLWTDIGTLDAIAAAERLLAGNQI
ncbi:MAG: nucleotidyltransferase family protein [Armatimonadetes bacterium]|nr:nucleotidyltransferase family protein [Armatimonadota bacterium]